MINGQSTNSNGQTSNKNGKNSKFKTKSPFNQTTNSKQTSSSTASSSAQQNPNTTSNNQTPNNKMNLDETKIKPDPPRNVTIQRVSQGYAISWLKPLNSSIDVSYYNIEYKEGEDGESKFWGPIKTGETSYIAKLKAGEVYR